MTSAASELVPRTLRCAHEGNVFTCSTCNELVPSSFWKRMTWDRQTPERDTYHVTALTSCLAKSYFERTSSAQETVESAWSKLRGTLIHYVARSLGWSELRAKMVFDVDGRTITVVGYIDAYDPETATIYDLKTTRFVNWQAEKGHIPHENHVAQVQCYYTLLERYGILVGYGLRKIASLVLKVTAVAVALFTIPLIALASLGVVQVDFAALARLLERLFTRLAQFALAVCPSMMRMFPASGSFALGLVVGVVKG